MVRRRTPAAWSDQASGPSWCPKTRRHESGRQRGTQNRARHVWPPGKRPNQARVNLAGPGPSPVVKGDPGDHTAEALVGQRGRARGASQEECVSPAAWVRSGAQGGRRGKAKGWPSPPANGMPPPTEGEEEQGRRAMGCEARRGEAQSQRCRASTRRAGPERAPRQAKGAGMGCGETERRQVDRRRGDGLHRPSAGVKERAAWWR